VLLTAEREVRGFFIALLTQSEAAACPAFKVSGIVSAFLCAVTNFAIEIAQINLRAKSTKEPKRLKQIFLIAIFLMAAAPAFAQTRGRRATPRKTGAATPAATAEAELKKLEREWFDAVVEHDAAVLSRIFADDFIALNNDDGSVINKAGMIEMLGSDQVKLDGIKSDEFKLRLYGTTAVVNGRATYLRDGRPLGSTSHIEVWAKRDGRWQVVSWVSARIKIKASVLGANAMTTPSGLKY